MNVSVRFAPSPTGHLHLGNARTALVNWLFARKAGGRFILRIDDTDAERSRSDYIAAIEEDLAWLGLAWDLAVRQSERRAVHSTAFARLEAEGRVYPCYETPDELAAKREAQRARGLPPRYDRAALALDHAARAKLEAEGRKPHWRLLLPERVTYDDLLAGPVTVDLASQSDPVLCREDGSFTYPFTSVVDDVDLAVSHIIRGEDHRSNTGPHAALAEALGVARPPTFCHLPLLLDAEGRKISKRDAGLSLRSLRNEGIEPRAVCLTLACLGTDRNPDAAETLDDLVRRFDLSQLGRAQPRLDPAEVRRLSLAILRGKSFEEVRGHPALEGATPALWEAVRGNIDSLEEVAAWRRILEGPIDPVIEDVDLLAEAARLLPERIDDEESARAWLDQVAAHTGRRGRKLFHPIRLALTGKGDGPALKHLLTLIARDRVRRRLLGERA